jgi:antitoxin (DNA-binding transcriptional repressor) of toxin-antitoxin stability system
VAAVVKLAEAKAHLSELLAKVERGEEFVIAPGKAADCPPWAP